MRLRTLCLTIAASIPHAATAGDGPAEAFRAFDLLGIWAPDCQRPISKDNPHVYWAAADGTVRHAVTFDGNSWAVVDTIKNASLLGADRLLFSSVRQGTAVSGTATIQRVGDRIPSVSSIPPDGHVSVKDSTFTSTSQPTVFDERCDAPVPVS